MIERTVQISICRVTQTSIKSISSPEWNRSVWSTPARCVSLRPEAGAASFRQAQSRPKFLQLLLDLLDERAIIGVCQAGWSPYRFPRLKNRPLIIALHSLNPLLAPLPRNRSSSRPLPTYHQLVARSSPVPLFPFLPYRCLRPTPS